MDAIMYWHKVDSKTKIFWKEIVLKKQKTVMHDRSINRRDTNIFSEEEFERVRSAKKHFILPIANDDDDDVRAFMLQQLFSIIIKMYFYSSFVNFW